MPATVLPLHLMPQPVELALRTAPQNNEEQVVVHRAFSEPLNESALTPAYKIVAEALHDQKASTLQNWKRPAISMTLPFFAIALERSRKQAIFTGLLCWQQNLLPERTAPL